ncbi:hypothetical protein EBU71_14695, partial [bacterium]|nr:hypothetical protein [Candidatus Elulimicrobium humile]
RYMADPKENVTRQNIPQDPRNPKDHLDSGYENSPSLDFTIPPVGIEDIDIAIHRLFDKTIGFNTFAMSANKGPQNIKKPYVIFATGERFALAKRLKPPRDKNKVLILPAISIRRTAIEQSPDDILSRGMNGRTGVLTIKRKLSSEDRDYQNLVNKQGLKHLQNVLSGLPTSTRPTGDDNNTLEVIQGGLLENRISANNIYEIITIPQPQFFTAKYEIVFWTNYTQHMTYMIQTYMNSFLPQFRGHKLETDKGYWFLAYTEDAFSNGENIDQFEGEERLIKYTFSINVKGYLLVAQAPTDAVPVRKWISAPNIIFDVAIANDVQPKEHLERPPIKDTPNDGFTLTDINVDTENKQTSTTQQRFAINKTIVELGTGKKRKKYVSILDSNQKKGETVFAASDEKDIANARTSF